jgi:hypothetical protein
MNFLELSIEDQRVYCEQAQAMLGLPSASIEKDFWVCWTLRELFNLKEWGEHLVFKGGTSLSKAWNLIERFSEDIDIVIDREFLGFGGETLSGNQQKKLVKRCRSTIDQDIRPALEERFLTLLPAPSSWTLILADVEEDKDQQTLLFSYPGVLKDSATYLRPVVKIELGARSDPEPREARVLRPNVCEAFPELLGNGEFSISCVAPRRTFWEKAMLLHEESFRPNDKPRRRPLARHYYDLWALIKKGVAEEALADTGLFERVAKHRRMFFGYTWVDYSSLRQGSLRLLPSEDQAAGWRADYGAMRHEMFFGDVPEFDEIMKVVGDFEEKFNNSSS